ncbi:Ig-like domain-containing protein [Streptomyces sp. NBC_01092]|uniref:Ig-like domain-containing protein n=1 Tax=Streptomyces sp. NBC_01092 TaxID=2903748 RepID=UPI003865B2E8|nr:Ig-like domain-containing protein [Streptomyces sp. NBC_01092]
MQVKAVRRPLAATLVTALAAGALVLAGTGAEADVLGSMEVSPATGTDTSGITLTTAAPCPEPATNLIVGVQGAGFPADGQIVVGNSPTSTYATAPNGGIVVPLSDTMRNYASTAGFTTLQGRYDFTLTCRGAFGSAVYGDFTAPIWFTSNTAYQNTAPVTATTTKLAASPVSPVVQGTSVKLTATVSPAAATGTVRFLDGTTQIGSTVTVSGGVATKTTSSLTVGTHALKAQFTPADPAVYGGSTSASLSYTVKIKPPAIVSAAKVTGTVRVGSTVTCSVSFSGASSVAYSWLRDGAVLSGATGRTRALGAADHAHKIACRAKATNSTGSTTSTSPSVTVALGPALKNGTKPSFTGTRKVGYKQTAKPGTWTPAAQSYSYVWKRDGRAITGATRSTYTPTSADRGHLLSLTVTAKRAGFAGGTATSAAVRIG